MNKPTAGPNCPPGLEYLTQINGLKVEQLVDFIEVFSGYDMNNKYVVKNAAGQQVYFAVEGDHRFSMSTRGLPYLVYGTIYLI
jgi:hypothetical protein